jgi:hypothetical protein
LYVSRKEIVQLLARDPSAPALSSGNRSLVEPSPESSRLARLRQRFGLYPFDLDLDMVRDRVGAGARPALRTAVSSCRVLLDSESSISDSTRGLGSHSRHWGIAIQRKGNLE